MTPTTKTELLKTHQAELTKSYNSYDVNGRLEYVYTASNTAKHGDPCVVTRMAYVGLSTNAAYIHEDYSTWDSSWELF
jgi:hypothetical protein